MSQRVLYILPPRMPCPPAPHCRPDFFFSTLFTTSFPTLVDWKVPGKMAFLHHLLDFVINRPVSEASLAGPDPDPCPEGADKSGICPAPSRHAFCCSTFTAPSRRYSCFQLTGRCRGKRHLPGTLLTMPFTATFSSARFPHLLPDTWQSVCPEEDNAGRL